MLKPRDIIKEIFLQALNKLDNPVFIETEVPYDHQYVITLYEAYDHPHMSQIIGTINSNNDLIVEYAFLLESLCPTNKIIVSTYEADSIDKVANFLDNILKMDYD